MTNMMTKLQGLNVVTLVNNNLSLQWPDYQKEKLGGTFGSPTPTVENPGILRLTLSTFAPNTSPQRVLN